MATNFPDSADDFATTSPTNLADDDSTGRTHSERHNDMESAMEAVQDYLIGTGSEVTFYGFTAAADTSVGTQTAASTSGTAYAQQTCDLSTAVSLPFTIEQIVWNGASVADTYELFLDDVSQGTQTATGSNATLTWSSLSVSSGSKGYIRVKFDPTQNRVFRYNSTNGGFNDNGLVFGDWLESTGNTVPMAVTFRPYVFTQFTVVGREGT